MISANGGLPAHRYTPQVTPRWPLGSEPASVFSEFYVAGLCRAQLFEIATLHPPFMQVLFFVVIGDTFFTGGAYKVIIAVTIPRVLEEPQHVLLPNTCSICDIRR